MARRVSIVIGKDEIGYFAYAPDLKGCHTPGGTLDEALSNVREAVELYVETLNLEERVELTSTEILTTSVAV